MRMLTSERGDTIIEVLLATVVVALVVSGAYNLTNRATRINQSSIERTLVSNQIREQVERIKGAKIADDSDVWDEIVSKATGNTPDYSVCVAEPSKSPFYLAPGVIDYADDTMVQTYTFNNDAYPADFFQVWVQATSYSGYIDFHVRGCWDGPGDEGAKQTGLIVRVNE
jgi:Tfp pilus assembly protein PilV